MIFWDSKESENVFGWSVNHFGQFNRV